MELAPDQTIAQTLTKKYQGDGFVIEDRVLKGDEKIYPINYKSVGELIFDTLNRTPEYIVQIDGVTEMKKTYQYLKERSVELAIWMEKEGISAGDIVSLCSSNHPDIDSIIFATMFLGATYNTFPHDLNLQSARHYINYIKPRVIFTCENRVKLLQEAAELENHDCKMIVLGEDHNNTSFNNILKKQSSDEVVNFKITSEINLANICTIMPTSGTTGTPKFICYTYETYMRWTSTIKIGTNMKNASRITLAYLYPEWEVHLGFLLKCFLDGSTQIFHADFDPHETCRIIEKYKVNVLILSTYLASLLCQSDALNKYDLQSVSFIVPLGTKLFATIEQQLRRSFHNAVIVKQFGMCETQTLTCSVKKCINPDSEGTVAPNVQLKIIDVKTGKALGQDQVGEICAKGPYVMTGYYKDPVATKLAFDNEGWFHTGDEGYYDENGEIFIVGRLKEVIRFRDADIYPSFIEQILLSHPDIMDAAVVGIDHEVDVEHPVAFVKINPESNVTEEDVLKLTCELEYSDTFKDSVIFIDEIPRSTNGKINRRALRERAEKFYKSRQTNL